MTRTATCNGIVFNVIEHRLQFVFPDMQSPEHPPKTQFVGAVVQRANDIVRIPAARVLMRELVIWDVEMPQTFSNILAQRGKGC